MLTVEMTDGVIVAALDVNDDKFTATGDLKFTECSLYITVMRAAIVLRPGHGLTACCLARMPVVLATPPVSALPGAARRGPQEESSRRTGLAGLSLPLKQKVA